MSFETEALFGSWTDVILVLGVVSACVVLGAFLGRYARRSALRKSPDSKSKLEIWRGIH